MTARKAILAGIRKALGRGPLDGAAAQALEARIAGRVANLIPARSLQPQGELVALFQRMAEAVGVTVARVGDADAVPAAVADYLAAQNLPAAVRIAPDPAIAGLPWDSRPTLAVSSGPARPDDLVSVTPAFAGIAETGTLMLLSGPDSPTTLNLLPDTHIVVLRRSQIVGPYEDAWNRLRATRSDMPRTVNLITGPSRTGDIELKILLGVHGPRRLHLILIED
ncbi:MAG: lactate utilization protein [Thalassobaculales bacterium]